jgi:hypothetical protein
MTSDQKSRMDVKVLAIAGCPGAALLEDRLTAMAAVLSGIRVSRRVIASEAEAAVAGMCGSPTFLVGGVDPFAVPGEQPGMACRLYRQDDGSLAPAPSAAELRRVLTRADQR